MNLSCYTDWWEGLFLGKPNQAFWLRFSKVGKMFELWTLLGYVAQLSLGAVEKSQLCGFTGNSATTGIKKNMHRCSQYVQHLTVNTRADFQPVGYQLCSRAGHKVRELLGPCLSWECPRDRLQPGWAVDSSRPLLSPNYFLGDIICS